MSIASLERELVYHARVILNNQKLRVKDLLEWSSGPVAPRDGEIELRINELNCVFAAGTDKRPAADAEAAR